MPIGADEREWQELPLLPNMSMSCAEMAEDRGGELGDVGVVGEGQERPDEGVVVGVHALEVGGCEDVRALGCSLQVEAVVADGDEVRSAIEERAVEGLLARRRAR